MTFVLCKTIGQHLFIFADTRISQNDVRLPPEQGLIKTTFLSSQVAISFAHSTELATRDIKKFAATFKSGFAYANVVEFFRTSSLETNNEYILAFINPLRVVKISSGSATKSLGQQTWIGDEKAFTRYRAYETRNRKGPNIWHQTAWASLGNAKINQKFGNILRSFQLTLTDNEIESAGDFYTVATNAGPDFRFMIFAEMYFDSLGRNPAIPTTGENFDYRFSILAPKQSGVNASAYYYPHAAKGYIFYGKSPIEVADQCVVMSNVSRDEFIDACSLKAGVAFDYITAAHYGTKLD